VKGITWYTCQACGSRSVRLQADGWRCVREECGSRLEPVEVADPAAIGRPKARVQSLSSGTNDGGWAQVGCLLAVPGCLVAVAAIALAAFMKGLSVGLSLVAGAVTGGLVWLGTGIALVLLGTILAALPRLRWTEDDVDALAAVLCLPLGIALGILVALNADALLRIAGVG
jgi:hypothetical protein